MSCAITREKRERIFDTKVPGLRAPGKNSHDRLCTETRNREGGIGG